MKTLLATLLLSLVSVAAHADAPVDATKMAAGDCARARAANKTCVLDMGDEKIEGNTPVNSGQRVDVLKFVTSNSLIHVRRDFIPEIIKTAEDL